MIEGRPRESLVQYENPIEVSYLLKIKAFLTYCFAYRFQAAMIWIHSRRVSVSISIRIYRRYSLGSKKQQLPPMDTKPSSEDILNAILPPREWVESGKHFIQYVSHQPASRVDVARLREMLDQKLMERQARESGICPVREELFS